MPSSFADVMAVGAATYAAEIAALNAAGLPTTFLHTGEGAPPCRCGAKLGGICSSPMRRTTWCGAGTRSRDGRWVPTATTRQRSPSPSTPPTTPPPQRTAPTRAAHPAFRAPTAGTGSGPVMSTEGTDDAAAAHVDAGEPTEVEDLLEDPRTDVEALCLCTLLWASTDDATRVIGELTARDFHRPVYGELLDVIAVAVRISRPHDPASIAAILAEPARPVGTAGRSSGAHCRTASGRTSTGYR